MARETFISHEKTVANARMYAQMVLVGMLTAVLFYSLFILVSTRVTFRNVRIPELITGDQGTRLRVAENAPRLSQKSLMKYFVQLDIVGKFTGREGQVRLPSELKHLSVHDRLPISVYRALLDSISDGKTTWFRTVFVPRSWFFFPAYLLLYFGFFKILSARTGDPKFIRGTNLIRLSEMIEKLNVMMQKEAPEDRSQAHFHFGKLTVPRDVEARHTLVLGTTGTGKSVFLNQLVRTLGDRRKQQNLPQKAVIYDVKGEFVAKHFQADDLVFYPFDERSLQWRFFNEIRDYPDLDVLATALYQPPKQSHDQYWYNAARDVFRTGLIVLLRRETTSNRDIWEFFSQPLQQIRDAIAELPVGELGALKHIDRADSNQAASVISILQERLQFFRYLVDADGPFSFREYIASDTDQRFLYLMNIQRYSSIFKPLMTFVVDIMIREALSLADGERDIFFLIDEFGSLANMPSIFDFLTMGRSKGGVLILANQDLGSVGDMYGKDKRTTFYNNFNTNVIFRLNCPETSEFLSKAFGEREVIEKLETRQMSPSEMGDRLGINEQKKLEKILLPTEFQTLEDFHVFVRMANLGVSRTEMERDFVDAASPYFLPRDYSLDRLSGEPNGVSKVKREGTKADLFTGAVD